MTNDRKARLRILADLAKNMQKKKHKPELIEKELKHYMIKHWGLGYTAQHDYISAVWVMLD